MPTAQPREAIEALEDPLLKAYAKSWERIVAQQEAIAADPARWRRRARLAEMQRAVEADMERLDKKAADWVAKQFPQVYGMGAAGGAADVGASQVVWTQIQQEAVESLARDLFDDLLAATKGVTDSTKRLVRTIARDEVLAKAIAGDTAVNAGRQMAKILREKGIHAVTYSNGAKHGLAEYSQMVVRTKTAIAYNEGALTGAGEVGHFEVFDGTGCGWTKHDDPMTAHGRIVTRDEASAHPISHPGCRRAFGARPDLDPIKKEPAPPKPTEEPVQQIAAYYPPKIDALPRLAKPDTIEGTLKSTNPLYQQVLGYDKNCSHVVAAQELRRRGFDVQATSIGTKQSRNLDDAFERWADPETGEPPKWLSYKSATDADMLDATKDWPEGGRGFVAVGFRMGGGHVFNVEKAREGLRFIDAQSGREIKFMDFGQLSNQSVVMRVDNLDPTDKLREFVEPAGSGPKPRVKTAEQLAKEKADDDFAAMMNASFSKPTKRRRR